MFHLPTYFGYLLSHHLVNIKCIRKRYTDPSNVIFLCGIPCLSLYTFYRRQSLIFEEISFIYYKLWLKAITLRYIIPYISAKLLLNVAA
jgi:hypothetical protein